MSRLFPIRWAILALLWMGAVAPLPAQPPPPAERPSSSGMIPFGGSEYFRFLLYMQRLSPVRDLVEIENNPSQTVVVLLGHTGRLPLGINGPWLHRFLQQGGAVLIATDQPTEYFPHDQWPRVFGIRMTGLPLVADSKDCYQGIERRIFIKPYRPLFGNQKDPALSIFENLEATGEKALATDSPTEMSLFNFPNREFYDITWLAKYPESTRRMGHNSTLENGANLFAASLRAKANGGRMVVMADNGVFLNGMMGIDRHESGEGISFRNGNFRFTNQLTSWLKEGGAEPRTKCLFIENGQIRDTFAREVPNVPPKNPKQPPPEIIANVLLAHASPWLREAENQNFFNRLLLSNDESYSAYVRFFIYLVTGLMLFLASRLLWRAYWKVNKPGSESANTLNESLPRGGLVVQQKTSQIQLGNLYEAMRIRIRDRFDRMGGQPNDEGEMPPLLIADYQDKGAQIRRDVDTLWQIGYGKTPVFIETGDWDPLNHDLERLMKQASQGYWSFGQEV